MVRSVWIFIKLLFIIKYRYPYVILWINNLDTDCHMFDDDCEMLLLAKL